MAVTAMGYLAAWGPFCVLCLWEMIVMPQVKMIYVSRQCGVCMYVCV